MRRILRYVFLVMLIAIGAFYFWAGSGTLNKTDYYEVINYHERYKSANDTFMIMTFNIGYLSGMTNNLPVARSAQLINENLQNSYTLLSAYEPDILGLQEIDFNADRSYNFNQLDSLAYHADYPNAAMAVNWDKSYVPFPYWPLKYQFGQILSGQAILSKMQILEDSVLILEKPESAPFYYKQFYLDRLVQIAKIAIGDRNLIVMNVHLEAFDKTTRESQALQALEVLKYYEKSYPVLLIGDFNSKPPFASNIQEAEITIDTFLKHPTLEEAINKETYLQNESNFFTFDTEAPYERLDYIFYTKQSISKINSGIAVDAGQISDHLPVWMRFTLNNN